MTICDDGYSAKTIHNKIRDPFKVKLYAIRSETKKKRKKERKKKREREKKRERKKEREKKERETLDIY